MQIRIETSSSCCGKGLSFTAGNEPLRGIYGRYNVDGSEQHIFATVYCCECGKVYEPDVPIFVAYFNEAVEKLFR